MVLAAAMIGLKSYMGLRYGDYEPGEASRRAIVGTALHCLLGWIGFLPVGAPIVLHDVFVIATLGLFYCLALSLVEGAFVFGLWSREQWRRWSLMLAANATAYAMVSIKIYAQVSGLGRVIVDFWLGRWKN